MGDMAQSLNAVAGLNFGSQDPQAPAPPIGDLSAGMSGGQPVPLPSANLEAQAPTQAASDMSAIYPPEVLQGLPAPTLETPMAETAAPVAQAPEMQPQEAPESPYVPEYNAKNDWEGDVDVKGFAPTHRNVIGKIADAILAAYGRPAIYEQRMQARDEKRAGEQYTSDPMFSIQAMMHVNPKAGREMLAEYRTQQRNDSEYGDKQRSIAGAMFEGATPETFERIRDRAGAFLKYKGIDPDAVGLPQSLEDVETFRSGAVPVGEQRKQQTVRDHYAATEGLTARQQDLTNEDRDLKRGDDREYRQGMLSNVRRGQDMTDKRMRDRVGSRDSGGSSGNSGASTMGERPQGGRGSVTMKLPPASAVNGKTKVRHDPQTGETQILVNGKWFDLNN